MSPYKDALVIKFCILENCFNTYEKEEIGM